MEERGRELFKVMVKGLCSRPRSQVQFEEGWRFLFDQISLIGHINSAKQLEDHM